MAELREFIYIDNESMNSNLSSLGRGLPSEMVESSEGESEKSGEAGGRFWGIGVGGGLSKIDRSSVETTLEISAPYRFQDLIETIDERGITVHENPDPSDVSRGSVVKIHGNAVPMSLFKFEVAIRTIREIFNQGFVDTMGEIEGSIEDNDVSSEEIQQAEILQDLIEHFTGRKVPLRISGGSNYYGVELDRGKMRMPPSRAFLEEQEYTLFGRVERSIEQGSSWDPILATSIMNRYMPGEPAPEEMREILEEVGEEMNIPTVEEDWELPGRTLVIQPIAMFW